MRSGVPHWMIDVIPLPIDPLAQEIATAREHLRRRWPETTVFFSFVSSAVGRRDLNVLYEAFLMAFDQSDDVALVLKAPGSGAGSVNATLENVRRSMPAWSSGRSPNVYVVPDDLTREQLLRLHGSVDCYVSCERGNGWDLPAFDSLAMGVPVVTTDFGGSTMFVDRDDCYVVPTGSNFVACDAALNYRHSLYSGQCWPYIHPSALAAELRRAHDDPDDRQKRGLAAAERLGEEFDRSVVVSRLMGLISRARELDFRSGSPAVARIAAGDLWPRVPDAQTFASDRRVHEAALAGLLLDPAMSRPGSPGKFIRAYKRATTFAHTHEKTLAGSPVRKVLSGAMAVPIMHPLRKLSAIAQLDGRMAPQTERLGDPDELRELATFVEDYERGLGGAPTTSSVDRLDKVTRSIERRYGPIKSPAADLKRLAALHNRYRGRVIVLGNDDSLRYSDLDGLGNDPTFAVDTFHARADQVTWRPTFYSLVGHAVGPEVGSELEPPRWNHQVRRRAVPGRCAGRAGHVLVLDTSTRPTHRGPIRGGHHAWNPKWVDGARHGYTASGLPWIPRHHPGGNRPNGGRRRAASACDHPQGSRDPRRSTPDHRPRRKCRIAWTA